ncbi:unnamed protein product [Urochloa humidicola]
MGKEGLMAVAQLKLLAVLPPDGGHLRLEHLMRSHVLRLLRTNLCPPSSPSCSSAPPGPHHHIREDIWCCTERNLVQS